MLKYYLNIFKISHRNSFAIFLYPSDPIKQIFSIILKRFHVLYMYSDIFNISSNIKLILFPRLSIEFYEKISMKRDNRW